MKLIIPLLLSAAALSSGSIVKPAGQNENFELLILHNNDMHARFEQTSQLSGACTTADREAGKCYGGFPRVAHVVKEARRAAKSGEGPPVLYLNAGDTYTGTAWFTIYKWKIAAEFINALQPDAVSLGNHEFDNGILGLTPFIKQLKCPVLAANLDLSKVPELKAERNLVNSAVFDINGTKVGVIGYVTPDTKISALQNNVEYIDEITAIENEVAKLKYQGVNILIALGHSGLTKDLDIATKVKDIDMVIGAHSHSFLWNGTSPDIEKPVGPYPMLVEQKSGRLVPTVQAYAYSKYLGKIHVVFGSDGEVLRAEGNPVLLDDTIPQDPDLLKVVNRYEKKIRNVSKRTIGTTSVNLDGQSCRLKECNMGNMITDAMIFKYSSEYTGYGWTDTPIAVVNSGAIRSSIASATLPVNITHGDLLQVIPFDGYIMKVSLNGTVLKEVLEQSVWKYNYLDPWGSFLQVSGIKVEYDLEKPPGNRVRNVYLRCGECLKPKYFILDKSKTYSAMIPLFLVGGGDGFSALLNTTSTLLDFKLFDCAATYILNQGPVKNIEEGRIVINNLDKMEIN